MSKITMKVTITFEYDADPNDYPSANPTEMARVDAELSPVEMLGMCDEGDNVTMTIVPVPAF